MTSVDTESSIVPGELFSRELKLLRGAHLGGRFLKLLGDTRVGDLDSEVVKRNRRYLVTALVDVRNLYH